MKGTGMLVGKLKITPKGDQSGYGSGFISPLKETMLKQTTK